MSQFEITDKLQKSQFLTCLQPPCSLQYSREFVNVHNILTPQFFARTSPPVDPAAPNFHPVSEAFKDDQLFGELEPKDTEWLCAGGFVTETQSFYVSADDGTIVWFQVIHSAVG